MVSLKALVFALALAGCGDTVNNYYTSDDDSAPEETSSGTSPENSCGNSPLTGKYIQEGCEMGSETPFQEDCTGVLTRVDDDDCSETYSSLGALLPVTYHGLEIFSDCSELERIELLRNVTPEEIFAACFGESSSGASPEENAYIDAMNLVYAQRTACYLETNPSAYLGRITRSGGGRVSFCNFTIWEITPVPFSFSSCFPKPSRTSWGQQCHDQFPNPDPCDYEGLCPE